MNKIRGTNLRLTSSDNLVIIYKNNIEIYRGLNKYDNLKDEKWIWMPRKGYYTLRDRSYIKIVVNRVV